MFRGAVRGKFMRWFCLLPLLAGPDWKDETGRPLPIDELVLKETVLIMEITYLGHHDLNKTINGVWKGVEGSENSDSSSFGYIDPVGVQK